MIILVNRYCRLCGQRMGTAAGSTGVVCTHCDGGLHPYCNWCRIAERVDIAPELPPMSDVNNRPLPTPEEMRR